MKKHWLNSYLSQIPHEIEITPDTLLDLFIKASQKYPHNKAITCLGHTLNFTELSDRVKSTAQYLLTLGVKKGDRVAVILPNSIQYPVIVLAAFYLGAVVVSINPLYTASEIEYVLNDSTPTIVFCLDLLANKLEALDIPSVKHVITSNIADPLSSIKRGIIKFIQKHVQKKLKSTSLKSIDFRELYYNQSKIKHPVAITHEDLAFIQYTGATTGRPKGAMLTHRNIATNVRQVWATIMPQMGPDLSQHIIICALPLYHIFSLNANLFTFLFAGSQIVMIPNPKDIKSMLSVMKKTPFTVFNSLDTLYHKLLATPEFIQTKFTSYKFGICGGMATRISVANQWTKFTNTVPSNCYGLSEASPAVTMQYLNAPYTGSAGLPIPSTEIEIRNQDNLQENMPIGENGIIFVRGPQVMQGYWNNPQQTANVLDEDNWLNTGDIGYLDEKGYLFLTNRVTEMILVSGFNVYPAEIERVISELPDIDEVTVLGYKDNNDHEKIHAFIKAHKESNITTKLIKEYCQKHLTKYKIPNYFYLIDNIPKTEVGKIDKKALIKQYLSK